jgi:hypothetical protein
MSCLSGISSVVATASNVVGNSRLGLFGGQLLVGIVGASLGQRVVSKPSMQAADNGPTVKNNGSWATNWTKWNKWPDSWTFKPGLCSKYVISPLVVFGGISLMHLLATGARHGFNPLTLEGVVDLRISCLTSLCDAYAISRLFDFQQGESRKDSGLAMKIAAGAFLACRTGDILINFDNATVCL